MLGCLPGLFMLQMPSTSHASDAAGSSPIIVGIEASSVLEGKRYYGARNIVERGTLRSWAEGHNLDGIGEHISLRFKFKVLLKEISIQNGFGIKKSWKKNNRIKKLRLSSDQTGVKSFTVRLKDQLTSQKIKFPDGFLCKKLKLTIVSVYRGTTYRDTCIAEVSIPGQIVLLPKETPNLAKKIIGKWHHEGEGWTLLFSADNTCLDTLIDYDDEGTEEKINCTWRVDSNGLLEVRYPDSSKRQNPLKMQFEIWPDRYVLLLNGSFGLEKKNARPTPKEAQKAREQHAQ
jgi:hypothetical protein